MWQRMLLLVSANVSNCFSSSFVIEMRFLWDISTSNYANALRERRILRFHLLHQLGDFFIVLRCARDAVNRRLGETSQVETEHLLF